MNLTVAAIGLLSIATALTGVWAVSVRRRDASIADICWGPGFVLLAWLYCALLYAWRPRPVLVASLITIWGGRLAWHIARRHHGEDPRYAAMRAAAGNAFARRSLFVVFWLQAALIWFVSLPMLAIVAAPVAGIRHTDIAGLLLFLVGFVFEAVGDAQLARFRSNPANRGRVLDTGLWRYTRHPNYFGDATLWWGVFLMATAAPAGWMTIGSPVVMTVLLLRVSGVALLERSLKSSKPDYDAYLRRTSAFIPWFPRRR